MLDPRPEAAIFDVDGTLCDVSGIRWMLGIGVPDAERVRHKNFDRFHAESVNCPPHDWVAKEARWFARAGYAVLVVTARKSRWFNVTWWWLNENRVPYHELYMRDDWDNRPDYEVKQDILKRIRQQYQPLIAYDDNPNVIRLWKENNIETIHVPGWIE